MKAKEFISRNAKPIIGASLLLVLMGGQLVGASSTLEDSLKSTGNIEYDGDGDGVAEVLFYSDDLHTVANGIDDLNTNIAVLSQNYETLADATSGYKKDIIDGLNSNVYKNDNIEDTAPFEIIIEKILNIPAPETATGRYYGNGDNSGLSTSTGQLSASNPSGDVNINGVNTLNLAVDEAVTLPSGYYPNDITIQNNVVNRGSSSVMLDENNRTQHFEAGYYDAFDVTTTLNPTGTVTYYYHHHSLTTTDYQTESPNGGEYPDDYQCSLPQGCFSAPYYHIQYSETVTRTQTFQAQKNKYGDHDQYWAWQCPYCGYSQSMNEPFSHTHDVTSTTNYDRWTTDSNDHPNNRVAKLYIRSCNLSEGQLASAVVTF